MNLRQADIESGQVCSVAERYAVVVTETGIEVVLHVVLHGYIRLHLLRVVIDSTVAEHRSVELRTPRTVLVVSLVTIPTHTEVVLELWQAKHALPLQTTVVLNTDTLILLTSLGGDQDDTVSSTATIEGRSSSTLQNGHILNVVGVDGVGTVTKVVAVVQRVVTVD